MLAPASHRVPFPLRGGFKRQEDSNGVAEAEPCLGGIDHAMLASASHRVLYPLWGRLQKDKRDSNGVAEAEHL